VRRVGCTDDHALGNDNALVSSGRGAGAAMGLRGGQARLVRAGRRVGRAWRGGTGPRASSRLCRATDQGASLPRQDW